MPLPPPRGDDEEKEAKRDPDLSNLPASPPPSSSSMPPTQLSPETLRSLVMACGEEAEAEANAEAENGASCSSSASAAKTKKKTPSARDRLRGQLGFCFEPMSWDDAVAAVADGGVEAMGKMGRTPEGVAVYWRWRDDVCSKSYASTADFVRVEIMGFEARVGDDDRKVAGAPPADAATRIIWRKNDFPYNFEAGIEHSNVWAFSPLSREKLETEVIERHRPKSDYDTCWYVNPAALASIPDVWHAHVLSRRKKKIGEEHGEKGGGE